MDFPCCVWTELVGLTFGQLAVLSVINRYRQLVLTKVIICDGALTSF